MTTHSSASSLAGQVAACITECISAAARAVDPHLGTRLTALANQLDALKTSLAGGSASLNALQQQAAAVTAAMKAAASDDSLYQALLQGQQLYAALQQHFPPH